MTDLNSPLSSICLMLGGSFSHNLTHVEEKDMGKNGLENQRHLKCYDALSRGATCPNLYPYVWSEYGGKWVLFQFRMEQEGYTHMGMFWGSFFNMGTTFQIQTKLIPYIHQEYAVIHNKRRNILLVLPLWV